MGAKECKVCAQTQSQFIELVTSSRRVPFAEEAATRQLCLKLVTTSVSALCRPPLSRPPREPIRGCNHPPLDAGAPTLSFIRTKRVGRREYVYEVEGFRGQDGEVHQRVVRYLGPIQPVYGGRGPVDPEKERQRLERQRKEEA